MSNHNNTILLNIPVYCGIFLANLLGCQLVKTSYLIKSYESCENLNFWLFLCIFNNCNFWMIYALSIKDIYILSSCYISWLGSLLVIIKLLIYQYQLLPLNPLLIKFQIVTLLYILLCASFETIILNINKYLLYGITCNIYQLLYYSSPLINLCKIIKTKNISSLYLPMMVLGTANTCCWVSYALINKDIFQIIPNIFALGFLTLQWIIYYIFNFSQLNKSITNAPEDVIHY